MNDFAKSVPLPFIRFETNLLLRQDNTVVLIFQAVLQYIDLPMSQRIQYQASRKYGESFLRNL